jgi:hypothetical protein
VIVVSDTSPILNLAAIGKLELLAQLYGQVTMPPAVFRELQRNAFTSVPDWMTVKTPKESHELVRFRDVVDPGEAEAIALALQVHADILLIDEKRGRRIAESAGLPIKGLLGVLADAKKAG